MEAREEPNGEGRMRIKSFELNNQYEAIYSGTKNDPPGAYGRIRIHGFAHVSRVADGVREESIEPFLIADMGFELCGWADNYIGIVPAGEKVPEWMGEWIRGDK